MCDGPLVAVIVVHWGSPEVTMECIRSVRACHYGNLHIFVIDNCPQQRLWTQPPEADPTIVYIRATTNTGYCGGNNLGILEAQKLGAEYILLLNNDAILDTRFFTNCLAYMERHPEISVISPKTLSYQAPRRIDAAGGELDLNTGETTIFGQNEQDVGQCASEKEITFAGGCAFFTRTRVFKQVGGFDENLFCYGEDVDISRRIVLAGFRMRYLPSAKVWHRHASITVSGRAELPSRTEVYYYWRNKFYNLTRYMSERFGMGHIRFGYRFVRRLASFALKHRRPDLSLTMLFGLFDSIAGRMGKRDYYEGRYSTRTR